MEKNKRLSHQLDSLEGDGDIPQNRKKKKKKSARCHLWNRTVKPQPYKQCPNFSDYLSYPLGACQRSSVVSCCQVLLAMPWQYRGEREPSED